jgi:glycine dehydrogenase subunit 2
VTPEYSIGRVHGFHGNALVLARALAYITINGSDGLAAVSQHAVLNANWLRRRLATILPAPYDQLCMHECTLTATPIKDATGIKAMDIAKGLLERGFHAPTTYFPLIVEEALMFEPTETESLQTLEALAQAIEEIAAVALSDPEALRAAPTTTPVRRLDEARAARQLVATHDQRGA